MPAVSKEEYADQAAKSGYVRDNAFFQVGAANVVFGWNTSLYPHGLKDYGDLLDPALAGGKIGVIEGTATSIVDFCNYLDTYYGADFVEKLAAQKPRRYPSAFPMAETLGAGEISAGLYLPPLTSQMKAGAPVNWGEASPHTGSGSSAAS